MIEHAYLFPHPPIILPDIGRGEEKKIQATIDAYRRASREIAALSPALIVVISPHSVMYRDYFAISPGVSASGSMARFHAPHLRLTVEYDIAFTTRLEIEAREASFPAGMAAGTQAGAELDHATLIPLLFIAEAYREAGFEPAFKVARLGVSGLSLQTHAAFGRLIAAAGEAAGEAAAGEAAGEAAGNIVVIASGDLSHKLTPDGPYGFAPEGPAFDAEIGAIIRNGTLDGIFSLDERVREKAAECGLRPLAVLAGIFEGRAVSGALYSYEGPFGVGYAVGRFSAAVC
jgi:aromatic ring-opening dioxygenase LigB subunit